MPADDFRVRNGVSDQAGETLPAPATPCVFANHLLLGPIGAFHRDDGAGVRVLRARVYPLEFVGSTHDGLFGSTFAHVGERCAIPVAPPLACRVLHDARITHPVLGVQTSRIRKRSLERGICWHFFRHGFTHDRLCVIDIVRRRFVGSLRFRNVPRSGRDEIIAAQELCGRLFVLRP